MQSLTLPIGRIALIPSIAAILLSASAFADECHDEEECVKVYSCHPGHDGVLEGGPILIPRSEAAPGFQPGDWNVETLQSTGPSSNRLDLVLVCDGYTTANIANFAPRAAASIEELFDYEPFTSYRPYFNIHRVDVISSESGVDNDPSEGINRNTALDMAFWCSNIERLLCVNTGKAKAAAELAPDADQIFAVANSTKYGGAGYWNDDIGTFSSDNEGSLQVAIHELGHSLGNLADEYDYGGSKVWGGDEPSRENVSTYEQAEMDAQNRKWHAWLGYIQPILGEHSTFEGANYSMFGIYRPTSNSMMRELYQPFNMPSREYLIIEIQKVVNHLESWLPAGSSAPWGSTLSVSCVEPLHGLTYRWYRNNSIINGAKSSNLDLSTLPLLKPGDAIEIVITDESTMVRNETARNAWMRESHTWSVSAPTNPDPDFNNDGQVNGADLGILLLNFGSTNAAIDLNGDGLVDGGDIGQLLVAWTG